MKTMLSALLILFGIVSVAMGINIMVKNPKPPLSPPDISVFKDTTVKDEIYYETLAHNVFKEMNDFPKWSNKPQYNIAFTADLTQMQYVIYERFESTNIFKWVIPIQPTEQGNIEALQNLRHGLIHQLCIDASYEIKRGWNDPDLQKRIKELN